MKIHSNIEQGSTEWQILRSGKVTASCLDNLLTPKFEIRTGQMPKTYLNQVLSEVWIGGPLPAVEGIWDLEQGTLLESYARPAFELETGLKVEQAAFIEADDNFFGASPDGIINGDTGVELKCPHLETHIGYILAGKLPEKYACQVHGSMYASGFKSWYFCSFRRNFPPLVLKIERDEEIQSKIAEALSEFRSNFDSAMAKLISINGGPPNPRNRGIAPFPTKYTASMDVIP
jgi:hypothetical protein